MLSRQLGLYYLLSKNNEPSAFFNRSIRPSENKVLSVVTLGDGSHHNYHHAFPWDYRGAEEKRYSLNWTLGFIDVFARLGCVTKRKVASESMVKLRVQRKGDGTHTTWGLRGNEDPTIGEQSQRKKCGGIRTQKFQRAESPHEG